MVFDSSKDIVGFVEFAGLGSVLSYRYRRVTEVFVQAIPQCSDCHVG